MTETERALKSVKYYGKSLSGKPLLEIGADNEPKCEKAEDADVPHGPDDWPLEECFTKHLLQAFVCDVDNTYGEKTLLDHCRKG